MKKSIIFLFMYLLTYNVTNAHSHSEASTRDETYICTVCGWNNADGSERKFNIYLNRSSYCEPCYVGREVDENGEESSLSALVKFVTSSTYSSHYTYKIKPGFIGAYLFNSNKLEDKYVNGDRASIEKETYVCTVNGWNSATGENKKIKIFLFQSPYTEPYYVGRDVDKDNKVSIFSGPIRFVTNPRYKGHYTYYVKTGFLGAYFFNTNRLSDKYIKE